MTRLFKGLGDETRLRIVALLSHGELCVCHLQEALELSQPNISRHLAVLRHASIVAHRRKGSWVYYRIADQIDPECGHLVKTLARTFAQRELLRHDVERLLRTKGPSRCG
jgi:ArsR family transcriptional regulator